MLQAGLFDDNPYTRATIYSFMRLRALRVEVDVKLALGEFSLEQAAQYLQRTVPMDRATARAEAAEFAGTPGQAISYQIGKIQLTELLSDAGAAGQTFSVLAFNATSGTTATCRCRCSAGNCSRTPRRCPRRSPYPPIGPRRGWP